MEKFLDTIDNINEWVGKLFRWSLVLLVAVMVFEVFSRYVFKHPTTWAFEISTGLYATSFMMCGAYALLYKAHVAIDILYEKMTLKVRAIFDIISSVIFFYPFLITILVIGQKHAIKAWAVKETHWGQFPFPIYLTKTLIPLFAFFCLLQGTATLIRAILALANGRAYESKYKKEEIQKCIMDDTPGTASAGKGGNK